jgi:hypothetical protein
MAELLRACGVKAAHEGKACKAGDSEWGQYVVNVDWLSVPRVCSRVHQDYGMSYAHQVRNPMDVINSNANVISYKMQCVGQDFAHVDYMQSWFPDMGVLKDPVMKAMYYYVQWNKLIETRPVKLSAFYRVEDIDPGLLRSLCALSGVKLSLSVAKKAIEEVPKDVNKTENWYGDHEKVIGFSDLPDCPLKQELEVMIERYGYAESSVRKSTQLV